MSPLGALPASAVGCIWKAAYIVLAASAAGGGGSFTGAGWWLAAGDRDTARAALVGEQGVGAEPRASISEQNRAIDGMTKASLAAQAAVAAKGMKYDGALVQIAGAHATTCDEAMRIVMLLLEGVR